MHTLRVSNLGRKEELEGAARGGKSPRRNDEAPAE
jgi:hypothetical protein